MLVAHRLRDLDPRFAETLRGGGRVRDLEVDVDRSGREPAQTGMRAVQREAHPAELLTEWDERVTLWRMRHFKVVARIIGDEVVGTQGTPVELLGNLIKNRLYPELWEARNELTELAKREG